MQFYPYQPSRWQITIPGLKGVVGFLVRIEESEFNKFKKGLSNHYSLHFIELGIDETFTKTEETKAIEYAHTLVRDKFAEIAKGI